MAKFYNKHDAQIALEAAAFRGLYPGQPPAHFVGKGYRSIGLTQDLHVWEKPTQQGIFHYRVVCRNTRVVSRALSTSVRHTIAAFE